VNSVNLFFRDFLFHNFVTTHGRGIEFLQGSKIINLNTTVTNLNARGILMSYCGRDKNMEYIHLTG
jgi:intracellular sulfur oxidation DsrE/DsrF family protein